MDPVLDEQFEDGVSGFWNQYKIPIILGTGSVVFIVISIVLLVKTSQSNTPIRITSGSLSRSTLSTESANRHDVIVDVEGAVFRAGIVKIPANSRVEHAIAAAGGLTPDADSSYIAKNINRAMPVVDGMKLYVPTIQEMSHNDNCATQNGDVAQSCGSFATSGGLSQQAGTISVNTATKEQLDALPGVGPVTAQKIIDNRPYAKPEDLVTKKAIGPALFEKLKNQLSL